MSRIISAAIGCLVVLAALAGGCWGQRHETQATRPGDYRIRKQVTPPIVKAEKTAALQTSTATPARHPSTPNIPMFMRVYADDTGSTGGTIAHSVPTATTKNTRLRKLPPIVRVATETHRSPPASQIARVTLSLPFAASDDQAELEAVIAASREPEAVPALSTSLARRSLQKPVIKSKNLSLLSPLVPERQETILATTSLVPATAILTPPEAESKPENPTPVATLPKPPAAAASAVLTKLELAPVVAMVPAVREAEILPIVPTSNHQAEADLWQLAPKTSRAMPVTIRYADEPQLTPAPRKFLFPRIQNTGAERMISKRDTDSLTRQTPLSMLPKHLRPKKNRAAKKSLREADDEVWVKAAWDEPPLDYTTPPLTSGLGLFQK